MISSLLFLFVSGPFVEDDAVNVLKSVMKKSPELITDDLPSWIAFHSLDRNSKYYRPVREEAFKYLTSFATKVCLKRLCLLSRETSTTSSTRMAALSYVLQVPGPFSSGSF